MTQNERVLAAFLSAPRKTLTTVQVKEFPFVANAKARISNLRELGHAIVCEKIPGTKQSRFIYKGYTPIAASLVETRQYQPIGGWRPIANGFQVMTMEGVL